MNGGTFLRFARVWAMLVLGLLLASSVPAQENESGLRAALDRLAGDWTGEVKVMAMDGFVLKKLTGVRRATWNGDILVVETVLNDGVSDYTITARQSIRLGRLESTVARPGQPEDRFLGALSGTALTWTNAEGNRRDAREQLSEREGGDVLDISSVEPMRALGIAGLVRMEGRFTRTGPAAAAAGATAAVRPPEGADDVTRALENERRLVTELRTQLRDTERRLHEAEAGVAQVAASDEDALANARARLGELETERERLRADLDAARREASAAGEAALGDAESRRVLEARLTERDEQLAASTLAQQASLERIAALEASLDQQQRDSEQLVAAKSRAEEERSALEARARELEAKAAELEAQVTAARATPAAPAAATNDPESSGAPEVTPTQGGVAASREQLIADVQRMERQVLELESERNAAREQLALAQRQVEETRRLRDETLLRFQTVVAELNTIREEKDRLARANVSLQAEVRSAQLAARPANGVEHGRAVASAAAPATTFDGKTADMVIAALQIIGVTRGDDEDKAILDGRVYRNGDLVEAQLGIVFVGIDDNALVFKDRRGREYRRRF